MLKVSEQWARKFQLKMVTFTTSAGSKFNGQTQVDTTDTSEYEPDINTKILT